MADINQLSSTDTLSAGDLVPVWKTNNGDTRKTSMTALQAYMQNNLTFPTVTGQAQFVVQYAAPVASSFTVTMPSNSNNQWLILSPTGGFAAGTITFPPLASLADNQEILIFSTQIVTTLTLAGNGANIIGAPSTISQFGAFRFKYNLLTNAWYRIAAFPSAGVSSFGTYAALTALTSSNGLVDNGIYFTYARTTEEDGGAGLWRYDSASTATANAGTILAIDGGGAGRFFRLYDGDIDPRWFGVIVGGSDSTTAMQACITASYGAKIRLPPGTITCTNLTITGELEIEGAGYTRSILQQKAAATGTFITISTTTSKHVVFRAFDIGGVATGDDCVALTSTLTSGTQFIDMLVVSAGRDGIAVRSTADDNTVISNTIVESCVRDGISFASGAVSGSVIGCRLTLNGRYSIYATGNTLGPGHRFIGNAIGSGVAGIHILNQNHCQISDNQIILQSTHGIWLKGAEQCSVVGNACRANTLDGIMLETGSQGSNYNTIADNVCSFNSRRGINLDTSPNGNTIRGNIITANGESGLRLNNAGYNSIIGNQIFNNGITTAPKAGIYIDDGGTGAASNNRIIGNYISDVAAGNQTTGIYNDASASNTTIIGNEIAATTEVNVAGGNILHARDNIGWVTQNRGNSSIASGATTVVISHGLDVTPEASDFNLMQSSAAPTNPSYLMGVTSITSTQFTVSANANPGASGLAFEWAVSRWV